MLKYIGRRIFIFIPTLFAISLIAFVISISAPGDPVESLITGARGAEGESAKNSQNSEKIAWRHKLGLDLPVFYFTLTSASTPDTLYRVQDKDRHLALQRLIENYGNWEKISAWHRSLDALRLSLTGTSPDSFASATIGPAVVNSTLDETKQEILALAVSSDQVVIEAKLQKLEQLMGSTRSLGPHDFLAPAAIHMNKAWFAFDEMKLDKTRWKNWLPKLSFHGYNQYHRWLFGDGNLFTGNGAVYTKGVIRGDFGLSYTTKLPVTRVISRAIPWSLFFTLTSVFLAYLISIPIGVRAAANRGGYFDRTSSVILFMLYSLPTFFMATLLLLTFANPDVFDIFEPNGVKPATGYPDSATFMEKARISLPYIILPLICYTYSSLAFLSRTTRVSMLESINQDYIRTARAKGLSENQVNYRHGFRNALLPIITVFSNIFPAAVGGSVILEFIFGIPGMGQEIITAIYTKDYPMIVCVFTLAGFMTLVGYLVADILYAIADPRISYSKK